MTDAERLAQIARDLAYEARCAEMQAESYAELAKCWEGLEECEALLRRAEA